MTKVYQRISVSGTWQDIPAEVHIRRCLLRLVDWGFLTLTSYNREGRILHITIPMDILEEGLAGTTTQGVVPLDLAGTTTQGVVPLNLAERLGGIGNLYACLFPVGFLTVPD